MPFEELNYFFHGQRFSEEYGVTEELSQMVVDYIDEVKELLSSDLWENIFLNCSKNEVFVLWLLYQKGAVNMTEIAEYILLFRTYLILLQKYLLVNPSQSFEPATQFSPHPKALSISRSF